MGSRTLLRLARGVLGTFGGDSWLQGSVSGLFMMGVANLQGWALDANATILSDRLEKVISGIALNQEADGCAMG